MFKSLSKRRLVLMLADMFAINAALLTALFFRFDTIPSTWMSVYVQSSWAYSLISLFTFCYCGFYKSQWCYMTNRNCVRLGGGAFLAVMGYVVALFFINQWSYPRTVVMMTVVLSAIAVIGIRLTIHLVYFWRSKSFAKDSQNLLIIGAGDAGESLVRDLLRKKELAYNPIGFLDDDAYKKGMMVHRVPVLGKVSEVKNIVPKHNIQAIIIAMPSLGTQQMRRIVTECELTGVQVKKIPSLFDIIDGRVNISEIKNVEPEDILGRDLNLGDREGIAQCLAGKVIMVTGAGGSIGSELCRQIVEFKPKKLILLDSSEFSLYAIDGELTAINAKGLHIPVVADVQSKNTIDGIFECYKPEIVFHAAAYKHVPLMEENVSAAIKNNVWGTRNVAAMAAKHHVERFIMISTDKAVNPTNVMGASKRVAEMVVQSMNGCCETIFTAVRFGNVLGSNGSVLPLFKKQIAAGGPVTVTHPEVVRYFMTIPEAVQLVMTAGALAQGGETYILEMGKPVKLVDMARSLIQLSGYEPDKDIEIKFVGLRPGEKLYEELLTDEEGIEKTTCERIHIGKAQDVNRKQLFEDVEELWQMADAWDVEGVLLKLKAIVPGFKTNTIRQNPLQNTTTEQVRKAMLAVKNVS